jgi:glycine dehydrogenase subunit 1
MELLGKTGLRQVAELCYHKAHYAAAQIGALTGFEVVGAGTFFHEFVVRCPRPVSQINDVLIDAGIIGGVDLGAHYPQLKDHMLLCVTETISKDEIDTLVSLLKTVTK